MQKTIKKKKKKGTTFKKGEMGSLVIESLIPSFRRTTQIYLPTMYVI